MMHTGAQRFADVLRRLGADAVFTLVGDHLNEALAALAAAGIRIMDMRHESGVTHAADAWARITRRPAVALVTGGPGHTNALTGIATAHLACSPLVAISGSRPAALAGRQSFQDIDQVAMTRPVVKWAAEVTSADHLPEMLAYAWREAEAGRPGPVHLTIPIDVFQAKSNAPFHIWVGRANDPPPHPAAVDRLLVHLREAERPVVIGGSGLWWSGAGQHLHRFLETFRLPLFTITMARGVVPDDHPLCFGYADPALNRAAHRAFQEADLFLILGKRLDYRLAFGGARVFPPSAKILQVDAHEPEFRVNRARDACLHAGLKETLTALAEAGAPSPREAWLERLVKLRDEWRAHLNSLGGNDMHPAAIYRAILRVLPEESMLSWDGGDFTHWGRAIIPALQPGGWLRLGPLGTIGSALPNAIALKLAHPDRPVVLFTGDGALGFYLAELDTLVRHNLPVVIIVGNDAGWGLERELQNAQGTLDPAGRTIACELRPTRYDIVMQGFGGEGETVDTLEQVAPAVERALASGKPYLVNINLPGARSPFTDWQIEGKRRPAVSSRE